MAISNGSRLYVADPKGTGENDIARSVFLDEYFEYKHDIFLANLGDRQGVLQVINIVVQLGQCFLDVNSFCVNSMTLILASSGIASSMKTVASKALMGNPPLMIRIHRKSVSAYE